MRLADLVQKETGVDFSQIMLLRHGNKRTQQLLDLGGEVNEYTALQIIDSKYDYVKYGVKVVVAVAFDKVFGVFRVDGIDKTGTTHAIASDAFRKFCIACRQPALPAHLFKLKKCDSAADGKLVTGWEGKGLASPLRSNGKLFRKIHVDVEATASDR